MFWCIVIKERLLGIKFSANQPDQGVSSWFARVCTDEHSPVQGEMKDMSWQLLCQKAR